MYRGYVRVSTQMQNEDRQLIAMKEFEEKECGGEAIVVYVDKQSGKDFDRTEYKRRLTEA